MKIAEIETNVFVNADHLLGPLPAWEFKGRALLKVCTTEEFYSIPNFDDLPDRTVILLGVSREECLEVLDTLAADPNLHIVESLVRDIDQFI